MTTARDEIAEAIALAWFTDARPSPAKLAWHNCSSDEQDYFLRVASYVLAAVVTAPESVRLELAALLNPWLPMKDELETLANDCQECAEGCEAESKYGDRRAWQSVAYRIRHALRHLPALPSEDK